MNTTLQEFKLLTQKALKFGLLFLVVDLIVGFAAQQLYLTQETGKYARITKTIEGNSSDILVLGSSHASRHFVPKILEADLQQSCYNAGVLGQGLVFQVALTKIILEKYTPKLIILSIDRDFLYNNPEAYDRLSDLHPYYWQNRAILKPILGKESAWIDFKLLFKAYQMNSTLVHAFRYLIAPQEDYKGYSPLNNKLSIPEKLQDEIVVVKDIYGIDAYFEESFSVFIVEAKTRNIPLLLVTSPNLEKTDYTLDRSFNKMKAIAESAEIPVIDFSNHTSFVHQYQLYHDDTHLNDEGATLFSNLLVPQIKGTLGSTSSHLNTQPFPTTELSLTSDRD